MDVSHAAVTAQRARFAQNTASTLANDLDMLKRRCAPGELSPEDYGTVCRLLEQAEDIAVALYGIAANATERATPTRRS